MNQDDDYVREPDKVVRTRLIDDVQNVYDRNVYDRNVYDDQEAAILQESMLEYEEMLRLQDEEIIALSETQFAIEEEKRLEKQRAFLQIKQQITKLSVLDKINSSIYDLILNIITLYQINEIDKYKITDEEYNNIVRILSRIRLPSEEIQQFKQVLDVTN